MFGQEERQGGKLFLVSIVFFSVWLCFLSFHEISSFFRIFFITEMIANYLD